MALSCRHLGAETPSASPPAQTPKGQHHDLVWEQHREGPRGPAEGGAVSRRHHQMCTLSLA
ncbi:hypothetical protein DVA81_18480, partial [Acinetobacter baumannii]